MPHSCSAWNCTNRFSSQTRSIGITFHSGANPLPYRTTKESFQKIEIKERNGKQLSEERGFLLACPPCSAVSISDQKILTGQVRQSGSELELFLQSSVSQLISTRTSKTSEKAQETLSLDSSRLVQEAEPVSVAKNDHSYALPSSNDDLRARLREALARVESLERERRNAKDREKRAKKTVSGLLEDLRMKKLINEDLKEQLDLYSGINK